MLLVVKRGGHPVPPNTRSVVTTSLAIVISRYIGGVSLKPATWYYGMTKSMSHFSSAQPRHPLWDGPARSELGGEEEAMDHYDVHSPPLPCFLSRPFHLLRFPFQSATTAATKYHQLHSQSNRNPQHNHDVSQLVTAEERKT